MLIFIVANDDHVRFAIFFEKNDPRIPDPGRQFIRANSGHWLVKDPRGRLVLTPEMLYNAQQRLTPEHLPTGYAYHGTKKLSGG